MPSSHLILCRPLLLLPPIRPSIRVFSNESTLRMRWLKYWSFSFSISPSNEHPGLIFRMDWLYLLAVQGTLKSLLQHHSSKASIFLHSQLSYPYMTAYEVGSIVVSILQMKLKFRKKMPDSWEVEPGFGPRLSNLKTCVLDSSLQLWEFFQLDEIMNVILLFNLYIKMHTPGIYYTTSSVQSLGCVQLFVTPWTAACQASLSRLSLSRVQLFVTLWTAACQASLSRPPGNFLNWSTVVSH